MCVIGHMGHMVMCAYVTYAMSAFHVHGLYVFVYAQARNLTLSHKDLCSAVEACHKKSPCLFGQVDSATLALTVVLLRFPHANT